MSLALAECLLCFYEVLRYLLGINSHPQNKPGDRAVLGFFHFGSPTQRCPCASSPWHIASWRGGGGTVFMRMCSVTTGNLAKHKMTVNKSSWKELHLPLPLLEGSDCRGIGVLQIQSPVKMYHWPFGAPLNSYSTPTSVSD